MNEIINKYLVSPDIKRWLEKYDYTTVKSERFYVRSDDKSEVYYLKRSPKQFHKVTVNETGDEEVEVVRKKEYLSAKKEHLGRKVVKLSHIVTIDGGKFIVHEYLKKFEGTFILHVHFECDKAMRESETHLSLQPFIIKVIDKDKKYDDRSLCLFVKPIEYDAGKLFEKIDAFEASNLFFWQVPRAVYVRDGVTLVLYKNLRLLHHYKANYQVKHLSATLHRLRVLMRRTATLLETFPELFNPNVQRFSKNLLLRYHEETKLLRYLYFLEELSATKDDTTMTLHSELKTLTSKEEQMVLQMFLSQPFMQLMQMLTREISEEGYEQFKPLRKEVRRVVKEHLKTFTTLLQSTKEGYDDEVLEKLYTSMDSLQTLLEDFFHIIGEKETQKIVDELNILLKPLREYRNCHERQKILLQMKAQPETTTPNVDTLLCGHIDELEEKIENALKLLRSSRFHV